MDRNTERLISYGFAFFAFIATYSKVTSSPTLNNDATARTGLGIFIGLIVAVIVLICCASYFTRNE